MSKYFIIEGNDGAGKSVLAAHLTKVIPNSVLLCEPTRGPLGQEIRRRFTEDPSYNLTHAREAVSLFITDRLTRVKELRQLISSDKVIIQDRSYWSTAVYQGDKFDTFPAQELVEMHQVFLPPEDSVIYLQVDPRVAYDRLAKKGETPVMADLEYVGQRYERFARTYNWIPFDANGPLVELQKKVLDFIQGHLSSREDYDPFR